MRQPGLLGDPGEPAGAFSSRLESVSTQGEVSRLYEMTGGRRAYLTVPLIVEAARAG